MDPNQPAPSQSPEQQPGQYDFFLNTPPPQKKKLFSSSGGGSKQRKILVIFGGLVLVIILFLVGSSLFGGNGKRAEELLVLAQQQEELIRVADLTKTEVAARNPSTQTLAANTAITVSSSQVQVIAQMEKYKVKVDEKKLALTKNSATDAKLSTAAANNTYDEVFRQTMNEQLKAYQNTTKRLFASSKNQAEKTILETAFKDATILLNEPVQ